MYRTNKTAFTFVELIVVITIMSILATIWFTVYQKYIWTSRDTNRITQLTDVHNGLDRLSLSSKLPYPSNMVNMYMSGSLYAVQWDLNESMIQSIDYKGWGFDTE
jgi:prepilin-type N-terminal cleavage/methylation domain-containing protein